MQPQEVVTALQGVAAKPVEIEAGAAGDEDRLATAACVEEPLEVVAPASILVELVEDPQLRDRQLASQNALAVLRHVPAQVPGLPAWQALGERRLSDLPGPGHEDHLLGEVAADLGHQIARVQSHGGTV